MPTRISTPPIIVTRELIQQRRRKRAKERQASFSKIGVLMLVLVIVILFTAAHVRKSEMMYVALLFVFIAIALFTYGFWSSVSKGEGVWQYIGKHNLQHQQISNPAYHYNDAQRFKNKPGTKVHMVAPPKMGGIRLQIYTPDGRKYSDGCYSARESPAPDSSPSLCSQHTRRSHHHRHRHHHHHHHHKEPSSGRQSEGHEKDVETQKIELMELQQSECSFQQTDYVEKMDNNHSENGDALSNEALQNLNNLKPATPGEQTPNPTVVS